MLFATALLLLPTPQTPETFLVDLDSAPFDGWIGGGGTDLRGVALGRLWMEGERYGVGTSIWTTTGAGEEPQPFVVASEHYEAGYADALLWVRDLGNGRALIATFASLNPGSFGLFGTDGTPEGTEDLGLQPLPDFGKWSTVEQQPPVGEGVAYLLGQGEGNVRGVFRTDGTAEGTWMLSTTVGAQNFVWTVGDRVVWPERVLAPPEGESFLWSLPMEGGDPELLVMSDWNGVVSDMVRVGDRLLFSFRGPDSGGNDVGAELWTTDGTSVGTSLLVDLHPGPEGSIPVPLGTDGTRAFLGAQTPGIGRELWTSDGTALGTVLVADLAPGPASGVPATSTAAAGVGHRLVLRASSDGVHYEPWVSDGTAGGTYALSERFIGPAVSQPQSIIEDYRHVRVGDRVVFPGVVAGLGLEPCVCDGVELGLMGDLKPGTGGSWPEQFVEFDGRAFFLAQQVGFDQRVWSADPGVELPEAEPRIALQPENQSSSPRHLRIGGGRGYFVGDTLVAPGEFEETLFLTDGTPEGTTAVDGPLKSVRPVGVLDGGLVYFRSDGSGYEAAFTDGVAGGGQRVGDFQPGIEFPDPVGFPSAQLGRYLYFAARTSEHGLELFRSDGTEEGTGLYADLMEGPDSGLNFTFRPIRSGGRLYFLGQAESLTGMRLYVADDGSAGAQLVASGVLGDRWALAAGEMEGGVVLATFDPIATIDEVELFRIDGATGVPTPFASVPLDSLQVTAAGLGDGVLMQSGDAYTEGFLFESSLRWIAPDGQAVSLIPADQGYVFVEPIRVVGALAYFVLDPIGPDAPELWRTDGTPGGTIQLGPAPHGPIVGAGSGNELIVAYDFTGGVQTGPGLWVTDGTAEGLRPLESSFDQFAGLQSRALGTVGDRCLFSGFSFGAGQELHGFELAEVGGYLARPFGQGCGVGPAPELGVGGELRAGNAVRLELSGLAPLQLAGVYVSPGPASANFGECVVALEGAAQLGVTTLDESGSGEVQLAVPAEAALVGLEAFAQGVSAVVGGPWLGGFELTNGVELVVGP